MNLSLILQYQKIDSLVYDTIFLEKPVSKLIDFDYRKVLEPPPKNTSNYTLKELKIISKYTANRSKQDIELIHLVDNNVDLLFINLLNRYKISYPSLYIKTFYKIIYPVLMNIKGYWNRPRPTQLAKLYNITINPIITDTIHSAAYPSGHMVYSSLVANIIKDLYPIVNHNSLDKIVNNTAKARVMQGVHFPSDTRASLIFTKFIFNKLNPILRKDYHDQI